MDLVGPMRTRSLGGSYYALTATDDHSKIKAVRLMPSKQETKTRKAWNSILGEIESLSRLKVERIRTDNGSEFLNHLWSEFNTSQRITHETSAPYTP
jgi:Integrase core domain